MNRRRLTTILLAASWVLAASAQEVVDFATGAEPAAADTVLQAPVSPATTVATSALVLPRLNANGTIAHMPFYLTPLAGYSDWSLHAGVNASLSASAIMGLGRRAGSGFANSLSLVYADTLTSRLSYSLGGYYSRLEWQGRSHADAGLTAMLGYRFNERWEAYVFAQKSLLQPQMPPQLYWLGDIGDKIGAAVRYNFNPSFSIQLSVWDERRPTLYGGPLIAGPTPLR